MSGNSCEPEALSMGALGGLVSFMSIYVKVPVKIGVGAFQPTVTILITVLDDCLYSRYFYRRYF